MKPAKLDRMLPGDVAALISEAEGKAKQAGVAPVFGSVLETDEYDPSAMNDEFAFVAMGSNSAIYWNEPEKDARSGPRFLKESTFRQMFSNKRIDVKDARGKDISVSWADAWLTWQHRQTYRGVEFFPTSTGELGRPRYLNLWNGFAVQPAKSGTYSIFRDHVRQQWCHGNDVHFAWIWAWFAQLMQRPREKPGTAIVARGGQGSGKTIVGEVFGKLLGSHHLLVDDPRYLTGQFNAHMGPCLLLQADEAIWAGDKAAEGRLKGLITALHQMIESKGLDPIPMANHCRVLMTTNNDYAVPAGIDERRYFVVDVSDRVQKNTAYFGEMIDELEGGGYQSLLFDLLSHDLSKVDLRETPKTGALLEQKIHHLDPVGQWLLDRLHAGAPTRKYERWPDYVHTSELYDDFVGASERAGMKRRAGETTFGMKLRQFLPGIVKRKESVPDGDSVRRSYVYRLPTIEASRQAFDQALGQSIEWGET